MNIRLLVAATAVSVTTLPALAGPSDYVRTPGVEYGERELELKFGRAKEPNGEHESAAALGFGFGATEFWFTELYLKYEKEGSQGTKLEAVEWENKFQLTEPGKYPVDVGFFAELEVPREHGEAYEFAFGPMFQTDFGKVQLNGNLVFERKFRGPSDEEHHLEMLYQWQAKYRLQPTFEFGLQGFGELGKWDDWAPHNEQFHNFGPAIFGKIPLGDKHALKYDAALLFPATSATPDRTFRFQTEYEF